MDVAAPDHAFRPTPPRPSTSLRASIVAKLTYQVGKTPNVASERDWFVATALAVRDSVLDCWFDSIRRTYEPAAPSGCTISRSSS